MDEFLHIAATWVHVLGVALWVGPQFFLAFAWVPASRQIPDLPTRIAAMRTITRRFAYIGGAGLVLILAAGAYLIADWRDYYGVPDDVEFTSLRFGLFFVIKMTVLLVMLAAVSLHMFVLGPRQLEKLEDRARGATVDEQELRSIRMQSMFLSIAGLLLTLAIMALGTMIGTPGWSLQDV
jgi:uncharacterized membrane protein